VIPPKESAAFVAAMENVLAVYQCPHDPRRPLVCLDEAAKQLVSENYEYRRTGTANLFMAFAPLEGQRHIKVTSRRAKVDYAHFLADLSEVHFRDAEKIVLVQDNLNTHTPASLYATFPPEKARRIAGHFEWIYTPKHGSWLNMAEAELSVLSRQCLKERVPSKTALENDVNAWMKRRNEYKAIANWQFTNENARVKLRKLYPSV